VGSLRESAFTRLKLFRDWAIPGRESSVVFRTLLVRDAYCLFPSELPGHALRPDFGGNGTRAGEDARTCRNFEGGKL
jgi:hypothetical protein